MSTGKPKKILITGMSGLIGGAMRTDLEGDYALSALNHSAVEGVPTLRADIADLAAIRPAFEGIDIVVHLAALASVGAGWDEILHHNIVGTYNVFEAARQAGVKRVVYASSGATMTGWENEDPYRALVSGNGEALTQSWTSLTVRDPVRPGGFYGTSKVFGEALARHYTDTSPLSILCLRIGAVTKEDRPRNDREQSVFCSIRDITNLLRACVEAPDWLKYDVFFGVSRNRWSYRDMEHTRAVLGFVPQDSAEER